MSDVFQNLIAASSKKPSRNPVRDAWAFSSNYVDPQSGITSIQMSVNPNSVKFTQTKRISTARKTIGATTFFKWSDATGRNLDLIYLTISGETGPISGLGSNVQDIQKTSILTVNNSVSKAQMNGQNWAKLYTLTAQPEIDPSTLAPTIWAINYKSLLFPNVRFSGFYQNVLDFTDDAMTPFSKKYSMTFVVTGVTPDITTLRALIGQVSITTYAPAATNITTANPG